VPRIENVLRKSISLCVSLVIVGALLPTAAFASVSPSLLSDKNDYAPGEHVVLTGSGWQVGESVHVSVNDDVGRTWSRDVEVVADEAGTIRDEFNLPDWFVATYTATASGLSGTVAVTFTDGNLRIASSGPTFTATWRKFDTNTTCNGSGNSNGSGTITPNAGQTFAIGLDSGQSLRVQVPTTAGTPSQNFSHWTGEASGTNTTVCIAGFSTGTKTATANYVLPDTTPPDTTITAGPTGTVTSSSATLSFSSTETGSSFQCSLDGAAFTSCTSPQSLSGLSVGPHSFQVKAIDAAGNVDPTPATRGWTVAPAQATTSLDVAPGLGTYGGSVNLTATLTAGGSGVAGKSIDFSLNGSPAGAASTNSSGVATVSASLAGINAGTYLAGQSSGVRASFGGDSANLSSSGISTLSVSPKAATVTAHDKSKSYGDQDPAFTHEVSGLEPGDSLSGVDCGVSSNHKDVGDYDITCAGNQNPNYSVTYLKGTLSINPKSLTGSFTASDKVYDGTSVASVSGKSLPGVIAADDVTLEVSNARFDNKNVGEDKSVNADLALSGLQAPNYSLSSATASTEADITPKSLTGSFTASDKVYDGTVDATITNRWLSGAVPGDIVWLSGGTAIFASPQAGTAKSVTGTGFSLSGSDAGNYVLAAVQSTTASILPAYRLSGFYSPVDMGETMYNTVKGGSTVPLKFEVFRAGSNYELSDVSIVKQPLTATQINCTNGVEDSIEVLAPTNGTSLRYDTNGSQFIYNWQTPKKVGACYKVTVETKDGISMSARFKMK
jgi:hypothetical protein